MSGDDPVPSFVTLACLLPLLLLSVVVPATVSHHRSQKVVYVQFHDMQELFEHDIQLDSHMSLVDPWTFASGAP